MFELLKSLLLVGVGGFAGACARFLVSRSLVAVPAAGFPLGTFVVNVVGCFIIGLLAGLLERSHLMTADRALLLITGFCGSFTTFSTFTSELVGLTDRGHWLTAILYVTLSLAAGIALLLAGRALAR